MYLIKSNAATDWIYLFYARLGESRKMGCKRRKYPTPICGAKFALLKQVPGGWGLGTRVE